MISHQCPLGAFTFSDLVLSRGKVSLLEQDMDEETKLNDINRASLFGLRFLCPLKTP